METEEIENPIYVSFGASSHVLKFCPAFHFVGKTETRWREICQDVKGTCRLYRALKKCLLTMKYIILELLSLFASASTTRTASKAQKTFKSGRTTTRITLSN